MISLLTASGVLSVGGAQSNALYENDTLMPNHVLYPVMMVMDRAKLEISPAEDQFFLKIEYAHRRLASAKKLLEKGGDEKLVLSTLTKSQKYLIDAALQTRRDVISPQGKEILIIIMRQHTIELRQIQQKFTYTDTTVLGQLIAEEEALVAELE